ncbi:MAG: hypothetical protein RLZZ611_1040 [Cyanobacteriota bacterium]
MLEDEPQALTDLVTQWAAGDFSSLPEIVLLSSSDINGAIGAYAISKGKIHLNADWLLTASPDQVNAVLTVELGHHPDGLPNEADPRAMMNISPRYLALQSTRSTQAIRLSLKTIAGRQIQEASE